MSAQPGSSLESDTEADADGEEIAVKEGDSCQNNEEHLEQATLSLVEAVAPPAPDEMALDPIITHKQGEMLLEEEDSHMDPITSCQVTALKKILKFWHYHQC